MDTLLSMKIFCQVVEHSSFTKAADRMHLSTAMVSKHVRHLEESIGAKLLLRNTRSLRLTEAGNAYYRQCAYALDTLQQAAKHLYLPHLLPARPLRQLGRLSGGILRMRWAWGWVQGWRL